MAAPAAGLLTDRYGPRLPMAVGSLCLTAAGALSSAVDAGGRATALMLPLIVLGCGVGFFVPANSTLLFASLPRASVAIGATLLGTARHLGMALGTTLGAVLYATTRQGLYLAPLGCVLFALPMISARSTRSSHAAVRDTSALWAR